MRLRRAKLILPDVSKFQDEENVNTTTSMDLKKKQKKWFDSFDLQFEKLNDNCMLLNLQSSLGYLYFLS